jgi:exodeoxyribonuclease VII small subunit
MTRASFRDELERLEDIVRRLEDSDLDLDTAIELFQEGVERLKTARGLLRQTELTVKKVIEAADGSLREADLDG